MDSAALSRAFVWKHYMYQRLADMGQCGIVFLQ
jgi:hypothetical protein